MPIPTIDLFAGPGGLGEGFESSGNFRIALSVECDSYAHRTLVLRSFFRQFEKNQVPDTYYEYLRGAIPREELFARHPKQANAAARVAKLEKLGDTPPRMIDLMVESALGRSAATGNWILIGGPPCQAYSLVGRSRRTREDRAEFEADKRHYLYKEYLRILERHQPAVFVMENVKGILSAKLGGQLIFGRICEDLSSAGYKLFGLIGSPTRDVAGQWLPNSFLVHSEKHGIPQARHRVFVVGVREDIPEQPRSLQRVPSGPDCFSAIRDLPKLWSTVSSRSKGKTNWLNARKIGLSLGGCTKQETMRPKHGNGGRFIHGCFECQVENEWFHDPNIGGICNHESRSHMVEDISRYAFASSFAERKGFSPSIHDLPDKLLPNHDNVWNSSENIPFADRFRVQVRGMPSSTITSHIAKDGHYYIHPDPMQARSLTVREAARLQTFPDNYFFEGPRTEQYRQVGNAVPPMLARLIAEQIVPVFDKILR